MRFATTKPNGANSHIAGSRNGRSRSGSCKRSEPAAIAAKPYESDDAAVISLTSDCQPGNGRKMRIPTRKLSTVETSGMPRVDSRLKMLGHQPSWLTPYATRALVAV